MKSVNEILQCIAAFYEAAMERPENYFRNVESMESELSNLEALYEFIVDDSRSDLAYPIRFGKFMLEKGYGTLGFAHGKVDENRNSKPPLHGPTPNEVAQMQQFGELWRQFLTSNNRLSGTTRSQSK